RRKARRFFQVLLRVLAGATLLAILIYNVSAYFNVDEETISTISKVVNALMLITAFNILLNFRFGLFKDIDEPKTMIGHFSLNSSLVYVVFCFVIVVLLTVIYFVA
ncbi:MAG: hypothetical protein AAF742_01810, partial [Pseudomonadota bacterium]